MLNNSEDQITALNNLEAFLHSKSNLMIITGKAGTGKTTLVRQIQEKAYENNWKTISLGVWGRSVSSIIQLTGIPSLTIAKYNQIFEDLKKENYQFKSFEEWYKSNYSIRFKSAPQRIIDGIKNVFDFRDEIQNKLLVIDEASTLEFKTLDEAFKNTGNNTKVVLIGDSCQLRAKNNPDSNLLDSSYWKQKENESNFQLFSVSTNLETSHRVSEGPLFELAEKLRLLTNTNLEGDESRQIIIDSVNTEEVIAVGKNLSLKIFEKVKEMKEAIFIAGKGEVDDINKSLREIYLSRFSGNQNKNFQTIEENEIIRSRCNGVFDAFMTGDEFIINKIHSRSDKFIFADVTCITRNKEFSKNIFVAFYQTLKNLFDSNQNLQSTVAIFTEPYLFDSEEIYWKHLKIQMHKAWESLVQKDIEFNLNKVDEVIGTTYGYAVTIEHAQGGEWDTVALSLGVDGKIDIPRYWYTAVSRAKKLLYVLPS